MGFQLEANRLKSLPDSVYYIPDFITIDEEAELIRQVYASPKPKWTQLSHRRLQNWGGLPHPKGMITEPLPEWLVRLCQRITDCGAFADSVLIPNHVLINEYLPGYGIMPHTDGPLYHPTVTTISLGDHTVLDYYRPLDVVDSSPSFDSSRLVADESPTADGEKSGKSDCSFEERLVGSVLLMPRSLVVVKEEMYNRYLHGIQDTVADTVHDKVANIDRCPGLSVGDTLHRMQPRISLTVRVVPKVLKNKIFLSKK